MLLARPKDALLQRAPRRVAVPVAFGAALLALLSVEGRAQDLPQVDSEITLLEGEMGRIEQAFQGQVDLSSQISVDERLNQGALFWVTKAWDQAATVLYGAITPENRDHPGYDDGLYQLAESLYQVGNYSGARAYFSEILTRRQSPHKTLAIQRLVVLAERLRDWEGLDEAYQAFLLQSGGDVPSEVRYLRGKGLFLLRRDSEAVEVLAGVPQGDPWFLRAGYLAAATKVRAGELDDALADFTSLAREEVVAAEDKHVRELIYIARGRLLYELDRLSDAIDAYQFIPWDSDLLTTMLYEVTWTYVRRGQLASQDESLDEDERKRRALEDYELALDQLEDLRALEPDSTRSADITLLMGSLKLQRGEYDSAFDVFEAVLGEYGRVDERLAFLMEDAPRRERIIQDILAMEGGSLTVETELPTLAARRAAENQDVRDAVAVFRELQVRRDELAAVEKMVKKLDTLLSTDNPAEIFPKLHEGLTRSLSLENKTLAARAHIADLQHRAAGDSPPDVAARLAEARSAREDLARKVASLPTTGEGMSARSKGFQEGFQQLERDLRDVTNKIMEKRAQLVAIDMLYSQATRSTETAPQALENTKRKIQEFLAIVESWEDERDRIAQALEEAKLSTTLSGGRGAAEQDLRAAYQQALDEENRLLARAVDTDELRGLRAADERARALSQRNRRFLSSLNAVVDAQVAELRDLVDAERANVQGYASSVEDVNGDAGAIRDAATRIALDHVRAEVHDIVVRGDVGLIDVAFARKQRETERIGRLQRQKAEELTDLNQAYADLTRDEQAD